MEINSSIHNKNIMIKVLKVKIYSWLKETQKYQLYYIIIYHRINIQEKATNFNHNTIMS